MKGLLLKELYVSVKQFKSLLFIVIIFSFISLLSDNISFITIYPSLISGMLPINLLSFDEKDKWCMYSAALPITKAQYVSAKYITGLIFNISVLILNVTVQTIRMVWFASFSFDDFMFLCACNVALSFISQALILPLALKFGSEKGRIIYTIVIVFFAFAFTFALAFFTFSSEFSFIFNGIIVSIIVMLITIALYAVSWWVSIKIYNKREF